MSALSVKDIMTTEVVSVRPEILLHEAAEILVSRGLNGMPVVDPDGKLLGILTEYDLISKSSAVHLPTFQFILQQLPVLRKDLPRFRQETQKVASLTVRDVMNTEPLTFSEEATYEEVVKTFRDHHRVNPIPVIDKNRKVVGVVSRFDILKPLRVLRQLWSEEAIGG